MKATVIAGVAIIIAIILISMFWFISISDRGKYEENWGFSDGSGWVTGTWGTELIVEYEDGTSENLNDPLPFEISFGNKKVSNFKYIISSKGTSAEYDAIEVDMSSFEVSTDIKDQEGQWGTVSDNDIISLDMDGEWKEIYSVQVDASELESLEVGFTYNLSFIPSGSITFRGSGSWTQLPLPSWFYLTFKVKTDYSPDPDDPYVEERWIEVEIGSGVVTD